MKSFTIEITNCGQCPYAYNYINGKAVCECEGCFRSLDKDRSALAEANTPIPEWCPMLKEGK